MRMLAGLLAVTASGNAAVVSQDWHDAKLSIQLNDGAAEIEWIGARSFRVARSWGEGLPALPKIVHDPAAAVLEEAAGNPRMKTRYLTLDVDRSNLKLRVRNGETEIATIALTRGSGGMNVRLSPLEKVYGLGGGSTGRLNLHGERLQRGNGFFFTSNGYGVFVRSPALCTFDLDTFNLNAGTIGAERAQAIDFVFYYGPSPKEILEQHQIVMGRQEVKLPLPQTAIDGWQAFGELVRTLNQWSLSGILYPDFNVAMADRAPAEVKQRVMDLAAVLPFVNGDAFAPNVFAPYLTTYLREAHDRGYPLIRPLPLEFSRDAGMDRQADVFMLGDELLVAPVVSAGLRRRIDLPRGFWTDLRTNIEYRSNQTIEVDAPPGRVPLFARNGSLFPLASPLKGEEKMELHYFPSLGGEYFLWEPEVESNSIFHAAPAGDYVRVEVETKVLRNYEWVLHNSHSAQAVTSDAGNYEPVKNRTQLRPGTWWHDDERNDLHILMRAEAGSDHIVNIMF
jgi:alpha-glucosidase (family GH31 glycosyl hydrolase)